MTEPVTVLQGAEAPPVPAVTTDAPSPAPVFANGSREFTPEPAPATVSSPPEQPAAAPVDLPEVQYTEEWPVQVGQSAAAFDLGQIQLAEFYGRTTEEESPAQPAVRELLEALRSIGVGKGRRIETYYGGATRAWIREAYTELLPDAAPSDVVGADLLEAVRQKRDAA